MGAPALVVAAFLVGGRASARTLEAAAPSEDEAPRPPQAADPGGKARGRGDEDGAEKSASGLRAGWPSWSQGPIAASIGPAVDELIRKHFTCGGPGGDEVPCFPVSVEQRWQYSVAESLEHLEFDDSPAPGRPPTVDEMSEARPGPQSASGNLVSFDPICKGRQLLRALTGGARSYHLYRVWDHSGERVELRERPLDLADDEGLPARHYVLLGTFGDECEAVAAWRKALRETRARAEAEGSGAADAEAPPR